MEKIRYESLNPVDGKQIVADFYHFTPEERNHLTEILKKHDKEKVENLVDEIEMDLDFSQRILYGEWKSRSHADQVMRLSDAIKKLKAASDILFGIRSGRFVVLPPRQCNFLVQCRKNSSSAIILEASRDAEMARQPLQRLVENLKRAMQIEKLKRGDHQRADHLDLAFQIAERFKKYIGTPRPHTGEFKEIVEYCFDIAGIRSSIASDRTRAIRSALTKLSHL